MKTRLLLNAKTTTYLVVLWIVGSWTGDISAQHNAAAILEDFASSRIIIRVSGAGEVKQSPEMITPFLGLIGVKEFQDEINLTDKQRREISTHLSRFEAILRKLLPKMGDQAIFDQLNDAANETERQIATILKPQQVEKAKAQLDYFGFKLGQHSGLKSRDVARLLEDARFWSEVEEPSRKARRDAIEQILGCLEKKQMDRLTELLDEDVLFGNHMRNDVLFSQLTMEVERKVGRIGSGDPFGELMHGAQQIRPLGNFADQEPSRLDARVPVEMKLAALMHARLKNRLGIVDSQYAEMAQIMKELRKAQDEATDYEREREDETYNVAKEPAYVEAEKAAGRRLDELLLDHQKESIREVLCRKTYPGLGIRWTLAQGGLGDILELSDDQKNEVIEKAKAAAEELKEKSDKLETVLFRILADKFGDDSVAGLTARFMSTRACGYPEAIIPPELLVIDGFPVSVFELRKRHVETEPFEPPQFP